MVSDRGIHLEAWNIVIDFDIPVDRRGTNSLKWERYAGRDVIPLWVADMDFRSPPSVIAALHEHVEHGVFGYTLPPKELVEVVTSRLHKDYNWQVEPEWILWLPGLVTGLNVACRAVGKEQDAVMTAVPVYPPFLSAPGYSGRKLVTSDLMGKDGRWTLDIQEMEKNLTPRTRLFILCNPHNPVGRIYTTEELTSLAAFCEKHDIIICSDEIHCDLLLDEGKSHIPIATLGPDIARHAITLMAPSKTYNLPGLGCSFAVIPDKGIRARFQAAMSGIVPHVNALGFTAALAAYRDCGDWLKALLAYLRGNRDLVEETLSIIPGLSVPHVEATYLAWIDTRATGLENPAAFFEEAGVGVWDGRDFGGSNAVRLNFACNRALLVKALERMKEALLHHLSEGGSREEEPHVQNGRP
ncbi:MAG: MalY/PatB family protein [Desulfatiglandales bacterium]